MNNLSKKNIIILTLSIVLGGIIFDQIIKIIFENAHLNGKLPFYLFSDVGFMWVENAGGAWSVFAGKTIFLFLVTLVGVPLFVALLIISRKKEYLGCYWIFLRYFRYYR